MEHIISSSIIFIFLLGFMLNGLSLFKSDLKLHKDSQREHNLNKKELNSRNEKNAIISN